MRGRKPHPSWRKALDGNPGHRATNTQEPDLPPPAETFDDVPEELQLLDGAAKEWRRVAPMLRQKKQITDADRTALIALCIEWDRYLKATDKVRTAGMVIMTASGYPIPNPYLPIANKALAACKGLWPELGMTPSSRTRVHSEGGPEDPFAEFDAPLPLPPATTQ
jgi:P27 family predicted phage terminase small subunit